MYYRECEYCGASLDPSDRCDCRDKIKLYTERFKQEKHGQMVLDFGKEQYDRIGKIG